MKLKTILDDQNDYNLARLYEAKYEQVVRDKIVDDFDKEYGLAAMGDDNNIANTMIVINISTTHAPISYALLHFLLQHSHKQHTYCVLRSLNKTLVFPLILLTVLILYFLLFYILHS